MTGVATTCHAVIECKTAHPGQVADFYQQSDAMQAYFRRVLESERRIFGDVDFIDGAKVLPLKRGDLSLMTPEQLAPAMDADMFVVFGSSVIKGWLIDALVERGAVNIHMGMSPYYRGSSCNFWALHDNNPHLVGATVHLLSRGVDAGDILYHVAPTTQGCTDSFDFSMATVRAAQRSLVDRLASGEIREFAPVRQDRGLELRYSRNADFTDEVAAAFLAGEPSVEAIAARLAEAQDDGLLIHPYREAAAAAHHGNDTQ